MDIQFLKPNPYSQDNFSSFCSGRGITSEGDIEEMKPPLSRAHSKHRILRYPTKKEVAQIPQIPLATFGDLKIANEQTEAANKSFN